MPFELFLPRRALLIVVAAAVLVGGAGVAAVYLPQATISLYPAVQEQAVTRNITLSSHADSPDFVRFTLPARLLEHTAAAQQSFAHEGGATHEDFARGRVVLTNDQEEEQPLLPRTHLRHEASGAFFLTDTSVTIPPHEQVTVAVTAKEKGAAGNVPAGKFVIDKLPPSLQEVVYGRSQQAFTGGVAVDRPLLDEEIDRARDTVRQAAEGEARGQLTAKVGGATIRPELLKLETIEEAVSAAPGSTASSFTVTIKARARAFWVDDTDLLSLTVLALRGYSGSNQELVTYNPGSFELAVKQLDFERGEAQVTGKITGTFAAKVNPTILSADNLAGRTPAEVEEYFKQYESVGRVEMALSPFWVKTVPARQRATEIVVKAAQ